MYHNMWGGPLDLHNDGLESEQSRSMELDRAALQKLEETQQSWLLGSGADKKKQKVVDLGCIACSKKLFTGIVSAVIAVSLIIGFTVLIVKTAPRHRHHAPPPDNYTVALQKALKFFNAQKSGRLPHHNNVSFRGNSGLKDGLDAGTNWNLVGGYYDAGDNIKFLFPQAYAMTLLSWSVIEYSAKYEAAGELAHAKELIKWGVDYMLKTFNSSAMAPGVYNETTSRVDTIYAQVGQGNTVGGASSPNDHYCWERPEDMDYPRPVYTVGTGSDLAGEMAASLAAASIVFKDNAAYSQKLVNSARAMFKMARDHRGRYSAGVGDAAIFYNSSGYFDEFLWGGAWLYYATGNLSYLQLVTTYGIGRNAGAYAGGPYYGVFDWDNKLLGAQVLLTRLRILQNPGYPYEEVLKNFHNHTQLVMCSYLPQYRHFPRTRGGLLILNQGNPAPLQYTANAAFLAALFSDYMAAGDVPGWYCGNDFYSADKMREFAKQQIDYILGKNPLKMSYVVGFGNKYPRHVHHRAASIPKNKRRYGCQEGWKFRDGRNPNPNILVGAMVGGPDKKDRFHDVRTNYNFTEPTIAGNAGLVGALVALSGKSNAGVDAMTIFSDIPPQYPAPPPPSPPWSP